MRDATPASWDPYEVWRQRILLPRLSEQRENSAGSTANQGEIESVKPDQTGPASDYAND